MKSQVLSNTAEYMSGLSSKGFTEKEARAISTAIHREKKDRDLKSIIINGQTESGKELINQRAADIANQILKSNNCITPSDVRLFKRCRAEEYMDRTGRCAWGFASVREKLGYDPKTGLELQS